MHGSHHKRAALLSCGTVLLLLLIPVGLTAFTVYRLRRQERLDHELIAAVKRNADRAVVTLLNEGADANCRDEPTRKFSLWQTLRVVVRGRKSQASHAPTPLLIALALKPPDFHAPPENIPLVRALLDHGAQVNVTDEGDNTPLYWAIQPGSGLGAPRDNATIRLLLTRGANARETGLLVSAAEFNGEVGMITELLDRGADVNQRDAYGETALVEAVATGNTDVVRLLLARHADVNLRAYGVTPLASAREINRPQGEQIIRLLRAAGARK